MIKCTMSKYTFSSNNLAFYFTNRSDQMKAGVLSRAWNQCRESESLRSDSVTSVTVCV